MCVCGYLIILLDVSVFRYKLFKKDNMQEFSNKKDVQAMLQSNLSSNL